MKKEAKAVKMGRKPLNEKDPLVHVGFRIPTSLARGLSALAKKKKIRPSELVRDLIEGALGVF